MNINKSILLVEDNPQDEKLILRSLRKVNLANHVDVVRDGQQALDYLFGGGEYKDRDLNDLPALILLDLKLPRISGLDVLRLVRANERTSRVPVVILTTSQEQLDIAQSYDLHANSYIRKPVDFAQFVEAIQHMGLYWLVLNEPPPSPKVR